jgi:hypothetical protein
VERSVSEVHVAEIGLARITGVVEELVASESNADGNGKREPLQLESGSSSDQNGRRDVDASNVLGGHWGRHCCRVLSSPWVVSC